MLGSGKQTLVLAHGYGGSQASWDNIVPTLIKNYKVLLFDWCFSGAIINDDDERVAFDAEKYSSYNGFADDLITLIDEMNVNDVVYVGHSMAGMIGCVASVKRPDLFSRLVLVGASPRYINAEGYEGGFDQPTIDTMLFSAESNFNKWAEDFIPLILGSNEPTSSKTYSEDFKRMRPSIALSVAQTVFLSDHRDVLEHVHVPCTVVQATHDAVVPISVGYYIQSKLRGKVSLEIVQMDGHCPQFTVPEKLIDVLERSLN
ncbi:uncharacterized protein A4U43_C01F21620 [Asparagus officinalis]|uniref:AB hydrolase-1 domain-containing protein n=2 Tax=Asparagus officinalis TaxID=4686 RepID=A0A5P1FRD0_ASPOF|nr:uncharacterized protein A4U43_C01F21620 [Asparagus officinalis]